MKRQYELKCDILRPLNHPIIHGFGNVLMIVDEYSRLTSVKLLSAKTEAVEKSQEFIAEHGIARVLRSDTGKDLRSKHFKRCFSEKKPSSKIQCLKRLGRVE